jgi:hypothetical protein
VTALRYKESEKSSSTVADRYRGIRCPKCKWRPGRHDRWQCSCSHIWNTFDTRGVCPSCSHAWKDTQCLACGQWSPHEAWYGD